MLPLKAELDKQGVRLVAIAGEELGTEEFLKDYWQGNELYYDMGKRGLWPIMDSGKNVGSNIVSYATGGTVAKNLKRANDKGVAGNLKGEGANRGGVWVLGAGEQGLLLEHQEKVWGDIVDPEEVRKAVSQIITGGASASSGATAAS